MKTRHDTEHGQRNRLDSMVWHAFDSTGERTLCSGVWLTVWGNIQAKATARSEHVTCKRCLRRLAKLG